MTHGCHLHKHCDHCAHYCPQCRVNYCCKCGERWPATTWIPPQPNYPIYPLYPTYPWYADNPPRGATTITFQTNGADGIKSMPTCSSHAHI